MYRWQGLDEVPAGWGDSVVTIGEFDGVAKYIRQEFTQGKSAAEVVVEEKNRENRLRAADKGHGMTRWDWAIAISPSLLFDRLADWAPDEAVRNRILVDNPVALYGFS